MADQWYGGQQSSGERWNVNMPAVVGVAVVFLLGVVIWVVVSGGDDPDSIQTADTTAPPSVVTAAPTSPPPTTTPPPMPATTPPSVAPTVVPTAAPTAAPTAPPPPPPPPTDAPTTAVDTTTTAAPTTAATTTTTPSGDGDLGVPGRPISRPPCDGSYIAVIASAVGDDVSAAGIAEVLEQNDGANYLRTDRTCPSLTQSVDGQPIYVVYFGPFGSDDQACDEAAGGPDGSYVRRLSNDLDPSHSVPC